jgi:hypothetical protein
MFGVEQKLTMELVVHNLKSSILVQDNSSGVNTVTALLVVVVIGRVGASVVKLSSQKVIHTLAHGLHMYRKKLMKR